MPIIILSDNDERSLEKKYEIWETAPYEYIFNSETGYSKSTISGSVAVNNVSFADYANKLSIIIRYTVS